MNLREDAVTLTQRGHRYALGRGADFYGVWEISTPIPVLVERFPMLPDGWYEARRRFEELETRPGEALVNRHTQRGAKRQQLICASIVLAGVVLGVAGLFPSYIGGLSLASQSDELLPHLFYVAGWALTGACLCVGGRFARSGAFFGFGLSAVTFGFYLSDLGLVLSRTGGTSGPGFYLAFIGWLACSTGCIGALYGLRSADGLGRPLKRRLSVVIGGSALALGAAVSFAPSWDRYVLFAPAIGRTEVVTAGNAFANPGVVVAGNVAVMVFFVALIFLALIWRPLFLGAAVLAGALLPLVTQLLSAVVQPTPPLAYFGITSARAAQVQLQITAGFTVWFYLYSAFVALLVLVWAFFARESMAKQSERRSAKAFRHDPLDHVHVGTAHSSPGWRPS
jgi:hypothetical protein